MSEQMRKAFEAWCPDSVQKEADGSYKQPFTRAFWKAWQAALATQPQAPQGGWHAPGIGEVHNADHTLMIYCSRVTDDEERVDDELAIAVKNLLNSAPTKTPEVLE